MADLKDSGARRDFGTGAVRDKADGKGRCDLLPLRVIGTYMKDGILVQIEEYVRHGDVRDLWIAIQSFCGNHRWDYYTAFLEAAKQYEDGCQKYGDRNWELGQPLHCFIDSGVRHYLKYLRGDKDEPHDRAFVWNMLGAIWTHENKPELIDLPFANSHTPTDSKTSTDDLDMGEEDTDEPNYGEVSAAELIEPITGKYDNLTEYGLHQKFCAGRACTECDMSPKKIFKHGTCHNLRMHYPDEFRKLATAQLEREGKA